MILLFHFIVQSSAPIQHLHKSVMAAALNTLAVLSPVLHHFNIGLSLRLAPSHLHLQSYKFGLFLVRVSEILQRSSRTHRCLGGMVGFH